MFAAIWSAVVICFWIVMIVALVVLLKKTNHKLYKSNTNRRLCGVCGGIGEAINIDPTIIRLLWVIFTLCGGSGILAYIIAAIVMPKY